MADTNNPKAQPPVSGFRLLNYTLKLWLIKLCISVVTTIALRLYPSALPPGDIKRRYPPLTSLETRIYLPPGYNVSSTKYPLYVSLHGGGYCFQMPDHGFCSALSTKADIAVASVTYRKAPSHPFPTQIGDVAKVINEILADTSLPIDREQGIIVGGFSAGGHAAMGVAQNPEFKDVIRGVVSMYAQLDHTQTTKQRMASRPKGSDGLDNGIMDMLQWAYIPEGHDLKDPLLSPAFAQEKDLPRRVYFVVSELDMLAGEQVTLAERILAERFPGGGNVVREEDETIVRSVGGDYEVVCELLKGMYHGFFDMPQKGWRNQRKEECLERLAEWVKRVFAKSH